MAYLQIYRNSGNDTYSHTILKGEDLYQAYIVTGEKLRWKYMGKVNPKVYQVPGVLIKKPSMKLISIIQRDLQPKKIGESKSQFESFKKWINEKWDRDFLNWKRQNVTLRGIKELGKENDWYGSFGKGLYSVPLSNKAMAKQYGEIYYLVNAKPKKPKVVQYLNDAEIFIQTIIINFCKKNGVDYDKRFFDKNTSIESEMIKLGYDGLIIKGREMVNYTPENVKYYQTEDQLYDYFSREIQ